VKIKLPKLKEQQKIASVLSNFDTDIKKLITHKKSLIQQKQGLMQQLLSGEKRVKI
jgi:type I restriction enzyme S subunit